MIWLYCCGMPFKCINICVNHIYSNDLGRIILAGDIKQIFLILKYFYGNLKDVDFKYT